MKNIFSILALAIFILVLVSSCAINEKQAAIVSGHPDWKPIMWRDGESIVGTGPNVTKMVFKELGVEVNSKYVGSWDIVQEKARSGEIDAIVALYKTKEREEYLSYSISYTVDPIVLYFVTGKSFAYSGKESLISKKGIATVGDSYGQELDDFFAKTSLDLTRVYTPDEAFSALKGGKADYFIYSQYAGQKVIADLKLTGFEESTAIANELFYMGISKKSVYANQIDKINSALQKLIDQKNIK